MIETKVSDGKRLTVMKPELVRDGSDRTFRQFLHDTLAFSARIQDIRDGFGAALGLAGSQYTILISIAHLEGSENGVGVNLLAEHLHLSGAFVTIELNKLVKAGLVSKKVNPTDRRRVLLTITAKAKNLLEELKVIQAPVNDALFGPLSGEDFDFLRQIMSKLVGSADEALQLQSYLSTREKRIAT